MSFQKNTVNFVWVNALPQGEEITEEELNLTFDSGAITLFYPSQVITEARRHQGYEQLIEAVEKIMEHNNDCGRGEELYIAF